MWVGVCVVELFHRACWDEVCGVSEFLDDCLKFFDCACDCLVVFEFVLDGDAEEFCVCVLFEGVGVVDV